MSSQQIIEEAEFALEQLKQLEDEVYSQAHLQKTDAVQMRYADGTPALAPLVAAKAQLLPILYDAQKQAIRDEEIAKNKERLMRSIEDIREAIKQPWLKAEDAS